MLTYLKLFFNGLVDVFNGLQKAKEAQYLSRIGKHEEARKLILGKFWGYTTTIAQFSDDDIILKSETPYNTKIVKRFCDWEDCERAIMLIEQDRRF